jgi:hypothetical protein
MTDWLNPANHADFETARDYAEAHKMHGLGLVITPGIAAGDLDHCIDPVTREFSATARAIIAEADTYTELSPSLTGIRFLAKGSFGGFAGTDHAAGIEFYEAGRFVTVTGNHIEETPFTFAERDLTELGKRYFPAKTTTPAAGGHDVVRWCRVDISALEIPDFTRHVIETGDVDRYQGDRSAALFGLAKDLLRAGLSAEDTARVLTDPTNGISAKALEERHGDLASALDWTLKYTVAKASAELARLPAKPMTGWHLITARELLAEPEPLRWLIKDYLQQETLSLLFGDPASGKSLLALDWAASLATGLPWRGHQAAPSPVVYLAGEGHFGIKRRLLAWGLTHDALEQLKSAPLVVSSAGASLNLKRAVASCLG